MRLSEEDIQTDLVKIANFRNKNERLSWERKRAKLEKFINALEPIEEKILKIIDEEKTPLLDEIDGVRKEMLKDCIHPKDMLVHQGHYIECKFCNSRLLLKKND